MASKTFFVTTPIYYPNDVPHIGHAYSSSIADVLARYHRMTGDRVKFSTGVDENSQKIVQKAASLGRDVHEFLDEMAEKHKSMWDKLDVTYTDFVRTTAPKHVKLVQEVLQKSYDAGDIYAGEYEGDYCVGCEGFKKPSDLVNGKCPDHPNMEIQHLKEKNYFFRLSKYQDRLLELYASRPDFVQPAHRFTEMIEFAKAGLEDFSISRESNKFGIPLPFDPEQVTYVWFDALYNYVSVCSGGEEEFWPANVHVVGKDILRFHSIFWPAMLMSAGYELPETILATGFFTVDGQKMSKSIGNVVNPVEFIEKHSRDLMVNYLLGTFPIGGDGDFSEKEAVLLFNARLANNVGNLLNRFIVLSLSIGGNITGELEAGIANEKTAFIKRYESAFARYDLREALLAVFEFGDFVNKYIDTTKPWELKDPSQAEQLRHIMYQVGESLRAMGLALLPFFTEKMQELLTRMGCHEDFVRASGGELNEMMRNIRNGFLISEKGEPLYMRISTK